METKINASFIKRASYATLSQLCKQMNVEFENQSKEKLQELLITQLKPEEKQVISPELKEAAKGNSTVKKVVKKIIHTKPTPIKKADNAKKASGVKEETKSSKILALYLKGKKVSEISTALNAHPSFCYTVITKHKKK